MITCLITARLASTRLPRKHLLDFGGVPVVEHVMRRCEHFGFAPILCVPEEDAREFNEVISFLEVFGGDPDNVEARLIACARQYKLDAFHHLDGDDPFFDEYAVIDSFNSSVTGPLARVLPSYISQSGTGRVGTSYNLKSSNPTKRNLLERLEHNPWPQRLTLDYPEDYHLLLAVNRMVGGYMAPRAAVDELFIRNPDLHKINWFRNQEWKERQRRESSL